jgi:hypothetical protein
LVDGTRTFRVDEDGHVLDSRGKIVRDGSAFQFPWPEDRSTIKLGFTQNLEKDGLLPHQRPDPSMGTAFGGKVRDKILNQHVSHLERDSLISGDHIEVDIDRLKMERINAMKLQNQDEGKVIFCKRDLKQKPLRTKDANGSDSEEGPRETEDSVDLN